MKQKKEAFEKRFTKVSIPTLLFERVKERIDGTDFISVSDYVIYVLNEILAEDEEEKSLTKKDEEQIKARLKALGYID
jgi:Arc/MetJ-type ribon-helix-helix transcriptional regulator